LAFCIFRNPEPEHYSAPKSYSNNEQAIQMTSVDPTTDKSAV